MPMAGRRVLLTFEQNAAFERLGGGFNGSKQHFNLFGKMECCFDPLNPPVQSEHSLRSIATAAMRDFPSNFDFQVNGCF
jgi:hypothetical protein